MIAVCKKQAAECVRLQDALLGCQIAINLMPGQRWRCVRDGVYYYVWLNKNIKIRMNKAAFNRLFEIEGEGE